MQAKQQCVDLEFVNGDTESFVDVYDVIDTASLISIAVTRDEIVSYPIRNLRRIRMYQKTNIVK